MGIQTKDQNRSVIAFASEAIEILRSFDLESREILKELKVSFEINGQTAAFFVVDMWGRRLSAEALLNELSSGEVRDEKGFAAGLATLRSMLQDIASSYLNYADRAGCGDKMRLGGESISKVLSAPIWPADQAITDYLRAN